MEHYNKVYLKKLFHSKKKTHILIFSFRNSKLPIGLTQTGKITAIRRIAVRETGVSRHFGELIEGPTKTPRASDNTIV